VLKAAGEHGNWREVLALHVQSVDEIPLEERGGGRGESAKRMHLLCKSVITRQCCEYFHAPRLDRLLQRLLFLIQYISGVGSSH